MKGMTKQSIAIILTLVMVVMQLAGCTQNGTKAPDAPIVSNEDLAVTEPGGASLDEKAEEAGWLEEELEKGLRNMQAGQYSEGLNILQVPEMMEAMGDDPRYNAGLIIGYLGVGNLKDAHALLDSMANRQAVIDEILNIAGDKMAEIKKMLMEHMLSLGDSDPEAFAAVAKIGANLSSTDPEDPAAYAARYIAAVAAGDEEAAERILTAAKAHNITAEELTTATVDYIEEYNLASVTVEQAKEGITSSTVWNEDGGIVSTEKIVGNKKYIYNSDGTLVVEVVYNEKTGAIISRTDYAIDRTHDTTTGKYTETLTGEKYVLEYENGVPKHYTRYDANGNQRYAFALKADGNIEAAYNASGAQVQFPEEVKNAHTFTFGQNYELLAQSVAVVDDNGNLTGKLETTYEYVNPVGLSTGVTTYKYDQATGYTKVQESKAAYTFQDDVKADYKSLEFIDYDADIDGDGIGDGVQANYTYEYEKGETVKATSVKFDKETGKEISIYAKDYVNHMIYNYSDGLFIESILDETNQSVLRTTYYKGNSADGVLYAKVFHYYEGKNQIAKLQVIYDEAGNMTSETEFEHIAEDGTLSMSYKVLYQYDANGNKKKITAQSFDAEGNTLTSLVYTYAYDDNNNEIKRWESGTDEYGEYEYYYENTYDESGNLIVTNMYTDYGWGMMLLAVSESTYDEAGRITYNKVSYSELFGGTTASETVYSYEGTATTVINKDGNGNVLSTVRTEQTADENGNVASETVYNVGTGADGEDEAVKFTEYTYDENGAVSGKIVTTPNADGGTDVTYYTAEGHPYQVAIYDTQGQLLMVMSLEPETAEDETAAPGEEAEAPVEPEVAKPEDGEEEATAHQETAEPESPEEETAPTAEETAQSEPAAQ